MRSPPVPQKQILAFFEKSPQKVFLATQLAELLHHNRLAWRLGNTFNSEDLIAFLEKNGELRRIELKSSDYSDLTRYAWGNASPYQVALSVRKNAYLSHGTAAFLHDITEQLPHTIYINAEQSPKLVRPSTLTQETLDRAFRGKQRQSNLIYALGQWRITVTAGKNTGRLEVGEIDGPSGEPLEATKLERTLIDLAVRPTYAGGPHAVLDAFRRARASVSINVLSVTLKKLAYVYPYHQVIGFYMERAGYESAKLDRLRKLPMTHNFYLTYGMKDTEFVEDWKLFVPKRF